MKKSLALLSLPITEVEYRQHEGYSYSGISAFHREGPKSLIDVTKKDSAALRRGSLIDTLLTEPNELDKRFLIADLPSISDADRKVVEAIHMSYPTLSLNDVVDKYQQGVLDLLKAHNYYNHYKDATKLNKIRELAEFHALLVVARNRTIISQDNYNKALKAVETLQSHPTISKYIIGDPFNDNVELIAQPKFATKLDIATKEGVVRHIPVRCMFDFILVLHDRKLIIPIDLKTTGKPEESFSYSFLDWMYYVQVGLYTEILQKLITNDDYFKDFKIAEFCFIVINEDILNPILWRVPKNINEVLYRNGCPDYHDLLLDMEWHNEKGVYDMSRQTYEGKGVRIITLPHYYK